MKIPLSKGCSQYGAQMGRSNIIPENTSHIGKLYLEKLRWYDGDYDIGGAYWGNSRNGEHIYRAMNRFFAVNGDYAFEKVEIFVRAKNRNEAKELVKEKIPTAIFYK